MKHSPLPKARFDIWGLHLEMTADHPLLYRSFLDDLRPFYLKSARTWRRPIRMELRQLPSAGSRRPHPAPFDRHETMHIARSGPGETYLNQYGRSEVVVLTDFSKRKILAGVSLRPEVLPDPAYHLCFTQQVSGWMKERNLFFIHAGGVSWNSKGILIIGASRAGKSILTLSSVRAGFKFLSDEQPILSMDADNRLTMLSFPRRARLDRSLANVFPETAVLARRSAQGRLVFSVQELWPGRMARTAKPRLLVFPRFRKSGALHAEKMGPGAAFQELLKDDHFVIYKRPAWKDLSERHTLLFDRLVSSCPAFGVDYSNRHIGEIPSLFKRLLR